MAAEFKSHVLRRDEKGFLGVPFKRWLLSGVCGGMMFVFASIPLGSWGIPLALVVVLLILGLTSERRGMPLWQRGLYRLRGAVIIGAARRPDGLLSRLASFVELPVESTFVVDGNLLFQPPVQAVQGDYTEWVTILDPHNEADGLVFVDHAIQEDIVTTGEGALS